MDKHVSAGESLGLGNKCFPRKNSGWVSADLSTAPGEGRGRPCKGRSAQHPCSWCLPVFLLWNLVVRAHRWEEYVHAQAQGKLGTATGTLPCHRLPRLGSGPCTGTGAEPHAAGSLHWLVCSLDVDAQAAECLTPISFNDLFVNQLVCCCRRGSASRNQPQQVL